MTDLNPKHLMWLAEIHEAGGFTEAAATLGTSQPALSRLVKDLEVQIGGPLFSRARKPLQLTTVGKRLVEQGNAIRTATKRACESVDRIRTGEEGELRIGGTPFLLEGFVSGLIAGFQADRPDVTVQFSHGYPDDLVSRLVGDRIDVAVCPMDFLDPEKNLDFTPLIHGRNLVACRTGHPLLSMDRLTAADLCRYRWIAPPPLSPLNVDLKNALLSVDASHVEIAAFGGGLGTIVNYLMNTDCLTILPHTVVYALHGAGAITALPMKLDHPNRTLGLLVPKSGSKTPLVEKLRSYLLSRFEDLKEKIRAHEELFIDK
ncbi:LysR family transcriptional regulator [Rhizobiales bacterium]|uniref:LysR family transcriptional regulator n=1 Tax=Hongsoonwoonella zoysiae TaxID=2821844 RepID=UPI00155F8810|nr:LysR family transcriptional regulator [Hongsoonwoonella zoysiae]NRG16223.1 LysR family transcriptional regulator [Hongsoonwoonella zoysiae]